MFITKKNLQKKIKEEVCNETANLYDLIKHELTRFKIYIENKEFIDSIADQINKKQEKNKDDPAYQLILDIINNKDFKTIDIGFKD